MLPQEPVSNPATPWNMIWNQYKNRLQPNRKSGAELYAYLSAKYSLAQIHEAHALRLVTGNVLHNAPISLKREPHSHPQPIACYVKNTGAGVVLYQNQDALYQGNPIFVGIDLNSGFFCVEGSNLLWDELYVYRGLDAQDIQNPYCVTEYITCRQHFPLADFQKVRYQPALAR